MIDERRRAVVLEDEDMVGLRLSHARSQWHPSLGSEAGTKLQDALSCCHNVFGLLAHAPYYLLHMSSQPHSLLLDRSVNPLVTLYFSGIVAVMFAKPHLCLVQSSGGELLRQAYTRVPDGENHN